MRLRNNTFRSIFSALGTQMSGMLGSRSGNFGLTFALTSVPMLLGIGVSIDYVRTYNVKVKMQQDLDAALIASVKQVDSLNEDQIKAKVAKWFAAQSEAGAATYTLATDTITISKSNRTINAVATGVVPTTFLGLANIQSVPVSVETSVAGPATSYLNVYLVLDKSASMMLAATTDGQTLMKKYAASNCVFACHTPEGDSKKFQGKVYSTNYALSKAMGVQLRTDVAVAATQEVISLIAASDPTQSRIKVGLYSIGTTAAEVLAPTSSTSTAKTTLNSDAKGLNSATSQSSTYFNTALPKLATFVGTAGDGTTASKPLKLVLILTDGVQSNRPWVTAADTTPTLVTPLNPEWCKAMKTAGATVGVLNTEYLPMTWDWGYNRTVGQTMKTGAFTTTWGGTMDAGVSTSTTRLDYIPYALKGCATSKDMFLSAADPDAIEAGLSKLFQQYLGSVRLTQ